MSEAESRKPAGTGKTGIFLDEKSGRYEFLLAGVQVAHVAREQYEPLTFEQRKELCGIVWAEVFKVHEPPPGVLQQE